MGDVIKLSERRDALRRRGAGVVRERSRAGFFFDLACPFTYLVAERIDRGFDDVQWIPAVGVSRAARSPLAVEDDRRRAEELAAALRLPLVWPDGHPGPVPAAMRVAAFAADAGRGGAFVLAASRLAFGGGFDLDDPEIVAEAAAAAGLSHDELQAALATTDRDAAILETGRRLAAIGADRTPALRVRRALHWGEDRIAEALSSVRLERAALRSV